MREIADKMNVIYGLIIAGTVIFCVMFMMEKVEDSRAQRIRAQVALINANASAREGRMMMTIVGSSVFVALSLIVFGICVLGYRNDGGQRQTQEVVREIHHHHTERIIERQKVIYLTDGQTKRDFYRAISTSKEVHYIES